MNTAVLLRCSTLCKMFDNIVANVLYKPPKPATGMELQKEDDLCVFPEAETDVF